MKNLAYCASGRNQNSETGLTNRNSEFNNLMTYFWNHLDMPSSLAEAVEIEPRLQIAETKDAVNIVAELPGIDEKDLDLQISSDGYLSISGEKKNFHQSEEKSSYFSEISYGSFKRMIPLPWDLDYEKVTADYKNGILHISIPKSQVEQQKFKKININQASA